MTYISSFVSRYHHWFRELGYPQLDIVEYEDGSWDIIEMLNAPVIPSLTRYNVVLGNMKHIIPSRGFVEKYCKKIDNTQKAFWDEEERKSAAAEDEAIKKEVRAEEIAEKCAQAVTRNPGLMERIAKNGMQEMNLGAIAKNISRQQMPQL